MLLELSGTSLLLLLGALFTPWNRTFTSGPAAVNVQDRPSVRLDHATVTGLKKDALEYFLGVPYAQPPVGDLRLRPPQLIESYDGKIDATAYGHPCLSQPIDVVSSFPPEVIAGMTPFFEALAPSANVTESEDCLQLNIVRPANVSANVKLPVVFWIHGGAFVQGSNAISLYNGTRFVERSVELDEPVIFVAINYRLYVLGFLGGNEIKDAGVGNLGLQDQRAALRWVNKHISAFGGDPSKVTIWGESAGSMSVFLHLYANNGDTEGLFRAAIMSSGFAAPVGDITDVQGTYDFIVDQVGCSSADDTLACLRTVPADTLLTAANVAPGGIPAFFPRAGGPLVAMPPMHLPAKGQIAEVPFITGDTKDEGTVTSSDGIDVTTDEGFLDYIIQACFPRASRSDLSTLLQLYPSDPAAGSPFDTGDAYAYSPQYKRIAAAKGDWLFHGPRRLFLDKVSAKRTAYNFLSARGNFPGLGAFHGTDLLNALEGGDMSDYFIRFVRHIDPNAETGVHWPPYDATARSTLQFNEGSMPVSVAADDQRLAGTEELNRLSSRFPL
ncbi:carotenoid ester lipase precursor [Lentinus brumalis]|uniref:Carboxylic ester hydrolase n=1 Tax=Lentinus brumalis TaxID=2498619 RepID=A0A371CRD5_9APHY|nr:carotenoid ester lipase precursor [Polyporus brumalis]